GLVCTAHPEVQRESFMGEEPGRGRASLELLHQASLADSGFATHQHDLTGSLIAARLAQCAELAQFHRPPDQWCARFKYVGLFEAEDAPHSHRLLEAFDADLADRLGGA